MYYDTKGIQQYLLFGGLAFFIQILLLRQIHSVACSYCSCILAEVYCCVIFPQHNIIIHSSVRVHLCGFQVFAVYG